MRPTPALFASAGDVGADLAAVDWARTPLGEPETWPESLRTTLRVMLASRFSMWMAWGPELTFFCNDAYRRATLGRKYPWALGRPASEVWSEIWPDIGPRIDHVLRTGEATWDEQLLLLLERSGFTEETYHTFSYSPIPDADGTNVGMLCVVTEETSRVVAERRMATLRDLGTQASGLTEGDMLTAACRHLSGAERSLPFTLVYLLDPASRKVARACTTGMEEDHPLAPDVLAADAESPWPVARVLAGEQVLVDLSGRADVPTGPWDIPPVEALVVPLTQPNSEEAYGFLVAALNPYQHTDEAMLGFVTLIAGHLAARLGEVRSYEFERQRAETLAALDKAKTDFFTNVSHEFRTPLTLLLGPVEEALEDTANPLDAVQRHRAETVRRNAQRLLLLVNSLLEFSRLEAGTTVGRFEEVDLGAYTADLASMFEAAAQRAGLRLLVDCPPGLTAWVDVEHWAKIVLNLLSNAPKFTFEGGIGVRLHPIDGGERIVLTVSDTGAGIALEEQSQLFKRFHRVAGVASRTHEGSGIGLALVAELVSAHDGDVEVHSTPGEGSEFVVTIPAGNAHLPAERLRRADGEPVRPDVRRSAAPDYVGEALRWLEPPALPADASDSAEGERPLVLVADDNADMRNHLTTLLRDRYRIRTAVDGEDALEQARQHRPDLVLSDVMMPRLDGFGLLRRLRADPDTMGIPVVMLSARAGEDGTVEGLEAGADDYLVKPFSARELRARIAVNLELDRVRHIRDALERNQELLDQAQRLAGVGSWEVDLRTGQVVVSDEVLRIFGLTRAEFDGFEEPMVLREMLDDAGREQLAEAVRTAVHDRQAAVEMTVRSKRHGDRLIDVRADILTGPGGPVRLRGSVQDITEKRRLEDEMADSAARTRVAAREHEIAGQLQRSLLPETSFDLEHLEVATFYQAGVEGTEVGGDWYDVIALGAGRSVLVLGDVMGRGVAAASVMGQVRSAARAYARLDLPPGEVLEHLDGIVRDLGSDQIVTAVYALFDSTDQTLSYANAGHLPPMVVLPHGEVRELPGARPPLGVGPRPMDAGVVQLVPGATLVLYTDGLVERRDQPIDDGLGRLRAELAEHGSLGVHRLPDHLVRQLLPGGEPDDDVAVLVARVNRDPFRAALTRRLREGVAIAADARSLVELHLHDWGVAPAVITDMVLMASELATNAHLHGRAPYDLRLLRSDREVVLELHDRSAARPVPRTAEQHAVSGRGLEIVANVADRWGVRSTGAGKVVWCTREDAARS
ncbi:MAG: SpoIIE family protein phosphatase [Marmoricola sp.]